MLKCRLLNVKLKPFQENIINLHNNISSKKKVCQLSMRKKDGKFSGIIYIHRLAKKKKNKKIGYSSQMY